MLQIVKSMDNLNKQLSAREQPPEPFEIKPTGHLCVSDPAKKPATGEAEW